MISLELRSWIAPSLLVLLALAPAAPAATAGGEEAAPSMGLDVSDGAPSFGGEEAFDPGFASGPSFSQDPFSMTPDAGPGVYRPGADDLASPLFEDVLQEGDPTSGIADHFGEPASGETNFWTDETGEPIALAAGEDARKEAKGWARAARDGIGFVLDPRGSLVGKVHDQVGVPNPGTIIDTTHDFVEDTMDKVARPLAGQPMSMPTRGETTIDWGTRKNATWTNWDDSGEKFHVNLDGTDYTWELPSNVKDGDGWRVVKREVWNEDKGQYMEEAILKTSEKDYRLVIWKNLLGYDSWDPEGLQEIEKE